RRQLRLLRRPGEAARRPVALPSPVSRSVRATSAAALLAGCAAAALLAHRLETVGALAAVLLAAALRAPAPRRSVYLVGVLFSSSLLFLLSPLLQSTGSHPLWNGPIVPVL